MQGAGHGRGNYWLLHNLSRAVANGRRTGRHVHDRCALGASGCSHFLTTSAFGCALGSLSFESGQVIAALPLCIAYAPARVSSSCDDLMDQLNEISFIGDKAHKERCHDLRRSLTNLNRRQGLGFLILETVVDKRYLAKIAGSAAAGLGTIISTLLEFTDHEDGSGGVSSFHDEDLD